MPYKSHNDTQYTKPLALRAPKKWKTRWACIAEAHESVRKRTSEIPQRDHEDHIAEKGFNSSSHDDHEGKPIPIHQAMKIPNAKAAFDKRSDKPEKLPAWQVEEVKSLKEVIERHKKRERLSTQKALSRCEATL